MKVYRYKESQRFRIIVDSACFYTTAKLIRQGLGDFTKCNAAAQKALEALEHTKCGQGAGEQSACGIAGTWEGLAVQLTAA